MFGNYSRNLLGASHMDSSVLEFFSNGKKRSITQEDSDSFLIEGPAQYLKWSLSYGPDEVEFQHGPRLKVGENFFDKGTIQEIEQIKTSEFYKKIVKVKVK